MKYTPGNGLDYSQRFFLVLMTVSRRRQNIFSVANGMNVKVFHTIMHEKLWYPHDYQLKGCQVHLKSGLYHQGEYIKSITKDRFLLALPMDVDSFPETLIDINLRMNHAYGIGTKPLRSLYKKKNFHYVLYFVNGNGHATVVITMNVYVCLNFPRPVFIKNLLFSYFYSSPINNITQANDYYFKLTNHSNSH